MVTGSLRRFLLAIHRHSIFGWLGLLVYALAVTFPHQWVQDVVGALGAKITNQRVYRISAGIGIAEAFLLTGIFLWISRRSKSPARGWMVAFWFVAVGMAVGTWRILTANNTELIHYPQYFPEGMALLALTFSPAESLAWVTLLASFDEGFQYIFLMTGRAAPFDFNDVYMDIGGAAAGIVFALAVLGATRAARKEAGLTRLIRRSGILALLGILAAGVALWATGKLALYDEPGKNFWFAMSRLRTPTFWYFSPVILGPHHFHELNPVEGPVLILITIAAFAILDRKLVVAESRDERSLGAST